MRIGDIQRFFRYRRILRYGAPVESLILVTAADQTHARSLLQFVASVETHEPGSTLVVYNLGFDKDVGRACENAHPNIIVRDFDFSQYPPHVNIKVASGQYAWKPIILEDIMARYNAPFCWMDAGNVITGPLTRIKQVVNATGFYCPYSVGTIKDWTHPGTLAFLNADRSLYKKCNLNGACIAVHPGFESVRRLISRWRECALVRECIAPEGSNRANHRQDQAVLTVLAHQMGLGRDMYSKYLDFLTHQDIEQS